MEEIAKIEEKKVLSTKIKGAEVTFEDYGNGKGKITINDWGFNGSAFWGAVGESLFDFLLRINEDYFVSNLGSHETGEFNKKRTFANFRKQLREVLPFYTEMEWQKETLRYELKWKQEHEVYDDRSFVDIMGRFHKDLYYYNIKDKYERKEIEETIAGVCSECWHYIIHDEHREVKYLKDMFKHIKKAIKKYQEDETRN